MLALAIERIGTIWFLLLRTKICQMSLMFRRSFASPWMLTWYVRPNKLKLLI
jgi:hypothetical protein